MNLLQNQSLIFNGFFIHALRIPPDFTSAIEAVRWVNWGIDPDDIIMAS